MDYRLDVDTVRIAANLSLTPARTQASVAMASTLVQQSHDANDAAGKLTEAFRSLQVPLGYPDSTFDLKNPFWAVAGKLAGWLLTIFALSLGAPFWFDTLSRITSLRQAGPKPTKAN